MFGVQRQRYVEGADLFGGRFLTAKDVEEVGRVTEFGASEDLWESFGGAELLGDGERDLSVEAFRLAEVGFGGIVVDVLVEVGQDADSGPQRIHRWRPLRHVRK